MENGGIGTKCGPNLDAVRALHQTVVALRAALEESKSEILELKKNAWPIQGVEEAIRGLTIENHVLKNQLIEKTDLKNLDETSKDIRCKNKTSKRNKTPKIKLESKIYLKSSKKQKVSASFESVIIKPHKKVKKLQRHRSITNLNSVKMSNQTNQQNDINQNENNIDEERVQDQDQDQDQEVDDIELIFTTEETKEQDFKEQLVSIDDNNLLQCPTSEDHCLDISDRELDDDVFNDSNPDFKRENSQLLNSKSDNSINHEENKSLKSCYSYQDSSFENKSMEKDESFDRFDDRIKIIETDISKCGIQDVEYNLNAARRYTCPNPLQYRPLLHREALSKFLANNTRKTRPILAHSNAVRKESGAQTEISALPGSSWLSESNLVAANATTKMRLGENYPTLPSKFPHPGSRLRLSEKTVEARRVLLSDIGFTSMVPELSRSADYLCPNNITKPVTTTYGQFLRTTDYQSPGCTSQKFTWATTASSSDGNYAQSRYNSFYPLSSPPAPSRRCSAPVSPSRRPLLKTTSSKVRFANGSLPELRGDWALTIDSGDSTDSLVEEAENYLRRSIDCIISSSEKDDYFNVIETKRSVPRRASAPEPSGDNVPPQGWQPFLPRMSRDLKPDHWVKVITPEGRVRGGRVRYIGPLICQGDEQFVGVQLSCPDGNSDGTINNRRYFQCEPYHGIFVPFKKVIMGWRP